MANVDVAADAAIASHAPRDAGFWRRALALLIDLVIVGTTVIFAYLLGITVFLLDLVYALVDPRVKVGSGG